MRAAAALVEESNSIADATDGRNARYAPLAVVAFRGREDESALIGPARRTSLPVVREWASRWRNGRPLCCTTDSARYDDALAAAEQAAEDPPSCGSRLRDGRADRSREPLRPKVERARSLEVLSETTRASGTPWARGVEARSRAMLRRGERPRRITARRPSTSGKLRDSASTSRARTCSRRIAQTRTTTDRRTHGATDGTRALLRVRDGGLRGTRSG